MTDARQLEDLWSRLAAAGPSSRRFRTIRAPDAGRLDVHVGLRSLDDARCLLFDLPLGAAEDAEFEAGGMRLARTAVDDGQSIVLSLEDAGQRDLFTTMCADLIAFAGGSERSGALDLVLARLEAWRRFLRSVSGGMSRAETIGLIGELHVLEQLVQRNAALVGTWRSPDDGLHDFEHLGHGIEVKAALGPGSRITISAIDQLDNTGLARLDLLHVRLFETPDGDTLDAIVGRILLALPDETSRREFANALLRRGLAPDDRAARTGLRAAVQQMTGYGISDGFPRLRRSDLAPAIIDASYALDLAQLTGFAGPAGALLDQYQNRTSA